LANAVFTTKVVPTYDDVPEVRYHFPRTYLNTARAAIGDWIVYYEPRREGAAQSGRSGRQAYFAIARLREIVEDPKQPDHYYARVSDYLEFRNPVPFRDGRMYFESALRKPDGSTNKGQFGRSVRHVPPLEFSVIVSQGFSEGTFTLAKEQPDEPAVQLRERVERFVSRPLRDRLFQEQIRHAYESTCAMTGLKLTSEREVEIEAAHIRPVADDGPDSPRNGLALSRTLHWMFDRGLVSLADDYRILVAGNGVPAQARGLLHGDYRAGVPAEVSLQPHRQFLAYHRERIFRG
jgi:putative restriction endonuclease